jgi:predicted ATPase/class 3 adenylate cyclase
MERTISFGYWLRRRRKALDLTQEQLAQQVGCAVGTIKKLEGDDRRPSRPMAERLADLLQIASDERTAFLKAARAELATDQLAVVTVPLEASAPALVATLPRGTVTFLFTDIQDSTQLWSQHPDGMPAALARHDALLRAAIERHGGAIFKTVGDAFHAAFGTATDALAAALAAQRTLQTEHWEQFKESQPALSTITVRMALHTGKAEIRDGDYFGHTLNRVARMLTAGHGGQVLCSSATWELLRDHLTPDVTLRDLGTHWLRSLPRPEHIYQLIAADLLADFPPLATLDRPTTNLPAQTTVFIGREPEIAAVRDLLCRADVRLVTLTGPGGTGKTRLSMQVAAALLDEHSPTLRLQLERAPEDKGLFPNGVWFVNLAPISRPDLVASAIAQTLDVRETGGQPIHDQLKDYLREKRMLLLLDNFEQIVDAAPVVSELLATAPGLRVLVTSRMPLHLSGEREFAVLPLALPPRAKDEGGRMKDDARTQHHTGATSDHPSSRIPHPLAQYDAVRLFIERAQAVKPDFVVTNENAPAVAEICARLDGLPLAIELAAVRVKLFPPRALLTRLDDRLTFLTGGARDLPTRQQTIRNAIDWSYTLLDAGEQRLFAQLGVFVGGCTIAAAEAVCTANEGLPLEIVDGIAALVDQSLLRQTEDPDGEPRFTMLETIRAYALERLEASGEVEALRRQHAEQYLVLAETAEPELHRTEQLAWLQRLEQEHDNLWAALAWSQTSAVGVETGLRLAGALGRLWQMRNQQREGRAWLRSLLAHPMATPTAARAKALNWAGFLDESKRQQEALFTESLAIGRALGDIPSVADALRGLGMITEAAPERTRALLEESLALSQGRGDTWRSAMALYALGWMAYVQGDVGRAIAHFEESLALSRQLGDRWGSVNTTYRLVAAKMISTQSYSELISHNTEILAQWRQLGDKGACAETLHALGEITRYQGEYGRAAMYYAESLALWQELGDRSWIAFVRNNQGYLAHNQRDEDLAAALLMESLVLARETGQQNTIAWCLAGLGWVAMAQGQAERAARLLGAAKAPFDATGNLIHPVDRAEFDRSAAAARATLGEEAFAAAWEAGRALTLEQAIAAALDAAG